MAEPALRSATYEDLFNLPDNQVGEIVAGVLYASPRPAPKHARSASILITDIGGPYDRGRGGPGDWWILVEPELHLDTDVLVPDLAGWRQERLPELPDEAWFELPPDWVCEVLSPSTARLDRIHKLPVYARHGVRWCWLVDPTAHTLEVFRLEGGNWVFIAGHGGDERIRAEPFDAVELDLAALWGKPARGEE